MGRVVSIGAQSFEEIRKSNYFLVDKTNFIKELWENGDPVTLITRPRRFGKTLNMDMLNCFFSNKFSKRDELFEGLLIWQEEKYRQLQGKYPVIFLSFATIKQQNYDDAIKNMKRIIANAVHEHDKAVEKVAWSEKDIAIWKNITVDMDDETAQSALLEASRLLKEAYQKKVMILLDEYDTPMQEAYVGGYWERFTEFVRALFNATLKTNPYLQKAVLTGITRVSKESIFSDLNNMEVVTTMSEKYASCFGFTEDEVFTALEEMGLSQEKNTVKAWYDGFTFGSLQDIYNPWSVTNFLDKKKYRPYWIATSSNKLINTLVQKSSADFKKHMEVLMQGECLETILDEQIVFHQLDHDEEAILSLMLAGGYLKVDHMAEYDDRGRVLKRPVYYLKLTNMEVSLMFEDMFTDWFTVARFEYNGFVKALLAADVEDMNHYMNKVALATFSYFDTGKQPSGAEPERFYHGFVLGLLVELRGRYEVISNGESGRGRYDVMLIPCREHKNEYKNAFILEFKVHDAKKEKNLEATVEAALNQIEEKQYDTRLLEKGICKEAIVHYGFGFEGKNVLIAKRSMMREQ